MAIRSARGKVRASTTKILTVLLGTMFDKEILSATIREHGVVSAAKVYRSALWRQKLLRLNPHAPCPIASTTLVSRFERLHFADGQVRNLLSPGCYFQNFDADIVVGQGCYIAPNVGIITANHDPSDPRFHEPGRTITIGDGVWIGMNAVLLPGARLGAGTIVGAGAVVTKPDHGGGCLLVGVPAHCSVHHAEGSSPPGIASSSSPIENPQAS